MAKFVKGDIVVIPFPFSDLSGSKRRPALVLATLPGNDIILCQVTSQAFKDKFAITLTSADFRSGSLPVTSYIRPNKIFTADTAIIIRKAGGIKSALMKEVTQQIVSILS